MAISLKVKRGTRSQIDSAAATASLIAGEPYLITDENRIAVGVSTSAFEPMAKQSEIPVSGNLDYGLISSSPTSTADYGSIA